MIFIGIGANLPSSYGSPLATCEAVLLALAEAGFEIARRSRWYESAPVPISDQPWYINGVIELKTNSKPLELLNKLHDIESKFGRVRRVVNEARVLDLDQLARHPIQDHRNYERH